MMENKMMQNLCVGKMVMWKSFGPFIIFDMEKRTDGIIDCYLKWEVSGISFGLVCGEVLENFSFLE
jgi:hypothetical protein